MATRIKTAEAMKRLDIHSRETLRQLWKVRKVIPAPIKDTTNGHNYFLAEWIDDYIEKQAAASGARQ